MICKKTVLCVALVVAVALTACSAKSYKLGDTGPGGGKIIYVSEPGFIVYQDANDTTGKTCHYLEAAPDDVMATELRWVAESYGVDWENFPDIAGTETGMGRGKKNTALILAVDPNAPAAKACNEYRSNGKNDWFLPSMDELNELYKSKDFVFKLGTDWYWSSSQIDYSDAWYQYFDNGVQPPGNYKNKRGSVRAVRAF